MIKDIYGFISDAALQVYASHAMRAGRMEHGLLA
jgi:hypothetical protein